MRVTLLAADADVICCPEAYHDFLAPDLHGMSSQPDYGYPIKPGRRKVTLWSRFPWSNVDDLGHSDLPAGRFVSGVTDTRLGRIRVIGVCVPWAAAHVSTGRCDRRRWEDHVLYLRGLRALLATEPTGHPTIIVGDVNQSIPRQKAPSHTYTELKATFAGYDIWTEGTIHELEKLPLCHIMGSSQLGLNAVLGFSRKVQGKMVSDHDGLLVELRSLLSRSDVQYQVRCDRSRQGRDG